MGFLGVAGIAIIALYVYAQGRRVRAKERAEAERRSAIEAPSTASTGAEPATAAQITGPDRE